MKIKHSILVPVYNQEDYISDALESIVNQTIEPFEVIVADDCSTDDSQRIIESYTNKYSFIKYIRHSKNIGLVENFNFLKKMPLGDVISWCSGDDLLAVDLLENLNQTIISNDLSLDDNFLIITNSQHLHPNGVMTLWDNYSEKRKGVFWARLRQGLSFRGVGFSKLLYSKTKSEKELINLANSKLALDVYKGFQHISDAEKIIYENYIGGIYRVEVGVTKQRDLIQRKESCDALVEAFKFVKKEYESQWDSNDNKYIVQQIKLFNQLGNGGFNLKLAFEILLDRKNYSKNNPAIKNAVKLLPHKIVELTKKFYPYLHRLVVK